MPDNSTFEPQGAVAVSSAISTTPFVPQGAEEVKKNATSQNGASISNGTTPNSVNGGQPDQGGNGYNPALSGKYGLVGTTASQTAEQPANVVTPTQTNSLVQYQQAQAAKQKLVTQYSKIQASPDFQQASQVLTANPYNPQLPPQANKENVDATYQMGQAFLNGGDNVGAQDWYKQTVQKDPNYLPAYQGLGYTALQQNNPKDALNYYSQAKQVNAKLGNTNNPDIENGIANAQYKLGNYGVMKQQADAQIANNDNTPNGLFLKGMAYNGEGDSDNAKKYWQQAAQGDKQYASLALGYITPKDLPVLSDLQAKYGDKVQINSASDLLSLYNYALTLNHNLETDKANEAFKDYADAAYQLDKSYGKDFGIASLPAPAKPYVFTTDSKGNKRFQPEYGSIEDVHQEQGDAMQKIADALEGDAPPELGWMNTINPLAWNQNIGKGIIGGIKNIGEGINTLSDTGNQAVSFKNGQWQADPTDYSKIAQGTGQIASGVIQGGFAAATMVSPELQAWNVGLGTADQLLPQQITEAFNAPVSSFFKAIGVKPSPSVAGWIQTGDTAGNLLLFALAHNLVKAPEGLNGEDIANKLKTGQPLSKNELDWATDVAHNNAGVFAESMKQWTDLMPETMSDEQKNAILPKLNDINNLTGKADQLKEKVAADKTGLFKEQNQLALANLNAEIENQKQEITNLINPKTEEDAVQKQSTGEVLQRQPNEVGETGSEREGVEQQQQGQETTQQGEGEEEVVKPINGVVIHPESIKVDNYEDIHNDFKDLIDAKEAGKYSNTDQYLRNLESKGVLKIEC